MYHREELSVRIKIKNELIKYGIQTDIENGEISYIGAKNISLKCKQIYLLRHAETIGTSTYRFMSSHSQNSILTEKGKLIVQESIKDIERLSPDCILYSDIPRVKETAEIIWDTVGNRFRFIELPWMVGIDNAGWENKTKNDLQGIDATDFYQREVKHNIFAKSSRGTSWGEVLLCCIKLIDYLNNYHEGETILLVSQGSVMIGLETILRINRKPWQKYNADRFFGLNGEGYNNYGKMQIVYSSK